MQQATPPSPIPALQQMTDLALLKKAAIKGDVDFLKKATSSKTPQEYYKYLFREEDDDDHYGNIFHLAVAEGGKKGEFFIKEAINNTLFPETTRELLLQSSTETDKWNPLHAAALQGELNIVKMFLDVYTSSNLPERSKRPWLQEDTEGRTPCFVAFKYWEEDCGIEILNKDMEEFSKLTTSDGSGLLYQVLYNSYEDAALQMLKSPHRFSTSGSDGDTPLHYITNCSEDKAKEIMEKLIELEPDMLKKANKIGETPFHFWALEYEIWPFEHLLETNPSISRDFAKLVAKKDDDGDNPLHNLVSYEGGPEEDLIKVATLLIETFKQETSNNSGLDDTFPWLAENEKGQTPLSLAIEKNYVKFATKIVDFNDDDNAVENYNNKKNNNPLFMAIENNRASFAEQILDTIERNKKWTGLLINKEDGTTALHLAPLLHQNIHFFNRLLEKQPELFDTIDRKGNTILHYWLSIGGVWQLNFHLENKGNWRTKIIEKIGACNHKNDTPLHVVKELSTNQETYKVFELLVKAYKDENTKWQQDDFSKLPWFRMNENNEGPLHRAIKKRNEDLALYILKLYGDHGKPIGKLLDYYAKMKPQTIFLAIKYNCPKVTAEIFSKLKINTLPVDPWRKYLIDSSSEKNILHFASKYCKDDKEFGKFLLDSGKEFINEKDKKNNRTPLVEACNNPKAAWFVEEILKKHPDTLIKEPKAWVNPCKKGYLQIIQAFIGKNEGRFRDLCIDQKDTPLHHIKHNNLWEYEDFLGIKYMKSKDILNLQNSDGNTPLHIAIQNDNIKLAQTLLNMENIKYDIPNHDEKTAKELLREKLDNEFDEYDNEWGMMCRKIEFYPKLKTSYFEQKKTKNLLDVRNTLSVVAALLATITFTAGFTLPGGLDDKSGEAILVKRISFVVFLITNTLAMCSSMLVLIFLVWSMVQSSNDNPNQSLVLIDRSMEILMAAFVFTLLAFMSGVYLVIPKKVIWLAIIIIVLCSLIGISVIKVLFIPLSLKRPKRNGKYKQIRNDVENPSTSSDEEEQDSDVESTDEESTDEDDHQVGIL